jgi:hypothetical protein
MGIERTCKNRESLEVGRRGVLAVDYGEGARGPPVRARNWALDGRLA